MLHCNIMVDTRSKSTINYFAAAQHKRGKFMTPTKNAPSAKKAAFDAKKDGFDKAKKGYEQGAARGKGNAEAVMEASKTPSKAAQEIPAEPPPYTRRAIETGTEA